MSREGRLDGSQMALQISATDNRAGTGRGSWGWDSQTWCSGTHPGEVTLGQRPRGGGSEHLDVGKGCGDEQEGPGPRPHGLPGRGPVTERGVKGENSRRNVRGVEPRSCFPWSRLMLKRFQESFALQGYEPQLTLSASPGPGRGRHSVPLQPQRVDSGIGAPSWRH